GSPYSDSVPSLPRTSRTALPSLTSTAGSRVRLTADHPTAGAACDNPRRLASQRIAASTAPHVVPSTPPIHPRLAPPPVSPHRRARPAGAPRPPPPPRTPSICGLLAARAPPPAPRARTASPAPTPPNAPRLSTRAP